MNTREAKEILQLYRGPVDDADPQFREALTHAQRDPELAEWLREQTRCYDADSSETSRSRTADRSASEDYSRSTDLVPSKLE